MAITDYIEVAFSTIFASAKGHDAKGFIHTPAFSSFPTPTVTVSSPEIGPSGSSMHVDHSQDGVERFPELQWTSSHADIKEYLLIAEDPDAPLPTPIVHGIYYGIPSERSSVSPGDFELLAGAKEPNRLVGQFWHGAILRKRPYAGPKPLLNHGPHRYVYTVVALSEKIDPASLSAVPKRDELAAAVVGKVVGWGSWTGVYERKWK